MAWTFENISLIELVTLAVAARLAARYFWMRAVATCAAVTTRINGTNTKNVICASMEIKI
ncbi:hypothetical protein D1872_298690 [compost metagenome]